MKIRSSFLFWARFELGFEEFGWIRRRKGRLELPPKFSIPYLVANTRKIIEYILTNS
jgi:hypothetical protein